MFGGKASGCLILMLVLTCVGVQPAAAQAASNESEAAALVKSRVGGRVLGVRSVQQNGRKVYRVKVLTQKGVMRVETVKHRRR